MTKSFNSGVIRCLARIELIWLVIISSTVACPNECSCKWKSGKQTVECLDRGLITVPSGIEHDTQVLDLSGNDLQTLRAFTFGKSSLINLQKLYLRACRIGQINRNAFQGLQNVVEIDLSANLLTHIPSQAFEDVPFLRNVSLANNPILKVEPSAFRAVTQLLRLDLSQCQLQMIQPKAFDGLDSLESLKLNDNQLREMPADTLQSLRQLRVVELQGNPWKCDCRLRGLKEWMSRIDNRAPYSVNCFGGPQRLNGKSIFELDVDDFACHPSIKADVARVETSLGSDTTLVCRVESDPIATITWYFGNSRLLLNDSIFNRGRRMHIEEFEDGVHGKQSRLMLKSVERGDAGQYRCVAENRAGVDEANISLLLMSFVGPLISFGGGHINLIVLTLAFVVAFMLLVIVLLIRHIRNSYSRDEDDKTQAKVDKGWMETCSQRSHDSEIKSDLNKALAVNSDYNHSPNDNVNPPAFFNTSLPITRPISDYCNWQQTYPMPGYNYESTVVGPRGHEQTANGDDTFAYSHKSNEYPSDYGLPILREDVTSQSLAKMSKIRQCGVPVLPPINDRGSPSLHFHSTVPMPPMPSYMPSHPASQMFAADERYQRCGTDV